MPITSGNLVLTGDQMHVFDQFQGDAVPVYGPDGRFCGNLTRSHFSREEVEEAKRDLLSAQRRLSTPEVLAHL